VLAATRMPGARSRKAPMAASYSPPQADVSFMTGPLVSALFARLLLGIDPPVKPPEHCGDRPNDQGQPDAVW
jgi:hypothetical protein